MPSAASAASFADRNAGTGKPVTVAGIALATLVAIVLNQILAANQLFYKVINDRTIMVIPDNAHSFVGRQAELTTLRAAISRMERDGTMRPSTTVPALLIARAPQQ